jgi:hypothetical protein
MLTNSSTVVVEEFKINSVDSFFGLYISQHRADSEHAECDVVGLY